MVIPVLILMVGGLLIYGATHDMTVVDALGQLLGRKPSGKSLGSLSPAVQSGVGSVTGAVAGGAQSLISGLGGVIGSGPLDKQAYSRLSLGRLDQGVDFSGTGPVGAIADGVVTHIGLWPGWPGDGGIVYQTSYGYIYVMEHFHPDPSLRVGSQVKAGQVIGTAPGGYPYIETGFANSSSSGPLTPYNGAPDGTPMPGAYKFKALLGL